MALTDPDRRVTSFSDISSKPAVQQALEAVYGNVSRVDAIIGGLAEGTKRIALCIAAVDAGVDRRRIALIM